MLVLTLAFSGCSKKETAVEIEIGNNVFGHFETTDMAGNPVNEEIFNNHKLTMINIWATFCGPCIEEMPYLAQLQKEYGSDIQIIGIIVDAADKNGNILPGNKAEAAAIIEVTGANYLHLLPSKTLNQAYLNNVQAVPETIFVDQNGNKVGTSYLGAKSKTQWKNIIDTLLENL